jgi:hypothetical protein
MHKTSKIIFATACDSFYCLNICDDWGRYVSDREPCRYEGGAEYPVRNINECRYKLAIREHQTSIYCNARGKESSSHGIVGHRYDCDSREVNLHR